MPQYGSICVCNGLQTYMYHMYLTAHTYRFPCILSAVWMHFAPYVIWFHASHVLGYNASRVVCLSIVVMWLVCSLHICSSESCLKNYLLTMWRNNMHPLCVFLHMLVRKCHSRFSGLTVPKFLGFICHMSSASCTMHILRDALLFLSSFKTCICLVCPASYTYHLYAFCAVNPWHYFGFNAWHISCLELLVWKLFFIHMRKWRTECSLIELVSIEVHMLHLRATPVVHQ